MPVRQVLDESETPMRRRIWSPDDPLWQASGPLLQVDKIREGRYPIDGIPSKTGSPQHHQLLIIGRGWRILRRRRWVLDRIGDHLGFARSAWEDRCVFLLNFILPFLQIFRAHVVWIQV